MMCFNLFQRLAIAALILVQPAFGVLTVQSDWVETTRTNHPFSLRPHERTKPIVVGDILYFANLDGQVHAVHRTKGFTLWKTKVPGPVAGALAYGRSKLFVGDTEGNLTALNARDGAKLWQFKTKSEWLSPPVALKGQVFATSSSEEVFALDIMTGKELWQYSHRGDERMTIRGTGQPVVFAGELFQGFADGHLVALSTRKGEELWSRRLRSRDRFYDVDMPPYVDRDSVVAATFDGKLYHLNRLNGETRWMFPVGSFGGFVVRERRLYFAGLNGNFYGVDLDSGQVIWKTPYLEGVGLTPTMVGENLVFTTSSDPVYLLNSKNGEVLWKGVLGAGTMAAASSGVDEWFYCLSNYGNLFSFRVMERAGQLSDSNSLLIPTAFKPSPVL